MWPVRTSLEDRRVLVVGVDPRTVPGLDAEAVEQAVERGQKRFEAQGLHADLCLIRLDSTAKADIIRKLESEKYACVVVGGGIRKPEPLLEFFETVVNLVRQHAPDAAIAFNTSPEDSAEAAMRWLPE